MGMCNHINHYMSNLAGKQATFRKLLKKGEPFIVTENMDEEIKADKKAMADNILLNVFDARRRTLVIINASGEGFGHRKGAHWSTRRAASRSSRLDRRL